MISLASLARKHPATPKAPQHNTPPEIRTDEHACTICGAPAHFGFGVKLRAGITGRWACSEHREALKQSHRK
jgi:hypothetical protein